MLIGELVMRVEDLIIGLVNILLYFYKQYICLFTDKCTKYTCAARFPFIFFLLGSNDAALLQSVGILVAIMSSFVANQTRVHW